MKIWKLSGSLQAAMLKVMSRNAARSVVRRFMASSFVEAGVGWNLIGNGTLGISILV